MSFESEPKSAGSRAFRAKLLLTMMVMVSAATVVGMVVAQRNAAENAKGEFERRFEAGLDSLHAVEDLRDAMLAERCRALARRPRIHAALEDNALDLLYPSARDELSDIMGDNPAPAEPGTHALRARFYRFLDSKGSIIEPVDPVDVGTLKPEEASQLALSAPPQLPEAGYIWRTDERGRKTVEEILAMPIASSQTGEVIAAIVLGFRPIGPAGAGIGIKSGLWLNGRLYLPGLDEGAQSALDPQVTRAVSAPSREGSAGIDLAGAPYLLFYKRLNPDSLYPPAYEISICPLAALVAKQRHLAWQFAGAGAVLLIGAFGASHVLARRLSVPVEKLAVDSEENRTQRRRAEAALEATSRELERSARFSADASHQLKTPVTVLRAGLEELLAAEELTPEAREEVSGLVHQTFRLTNVIEDLLLLSRMDAGRLQIRFEPVNLTELVETWLDDLGALPDAGGVELETDLPPALMISGEKRYTSMVVQNLLENARKYNRSGGCVRVVAREEGPEAVLTVGNTGRAIPPAAQEHIFERFHRGSMGENVPGHGLGLNLARELARLHGGRLVLARSDEAWTEFEVRFKLAGRTGPASV